MIESLKQSVILLVEDDPGDQELTRRALEEGGIAHRLVITDDGEAALDYLYQRGAYADPETSPRPDLILLDLNLPKIDGREVIRRIRLEPSLRRIPVVMFSTSSRDEDVGSAYELGVNSYIVKPSGAEELMRAIAALQTYWFGAVLLPPE